MELSACRRRQEIGAEAHPQILHPGRLRLGGEGEIGLAVLHAAVGEYVVCARGQVYRHAPELVAKLLPVGVGARRHGVAPGVIENDGQAVHLGGERVGELHVVVVDET